MTRFGAAYVSMVASTSMLGFVKDNMYIFFYKWHWFTPFVVFQLVVSFRHPSYELIFMLFVFFSRALVVREKHGVKYLFIWVVPTANTISNPFFLSLISSLHHANVKPAPSQPGDVII